MTFTALEGPHNPGPDHYRPTRGWSRAARLNHLRGLLRAYGFAHRWWAMNPGCGEGEGLRALTRANYLDGRIALIEEAMRREAWPAR